MHFYDTLHECKTDPRAFCIRVKFIEQTKHAFMLLGHNTNSIIAYKEKSSLIFILYADFDYRVLLAAHEFCRIIYQILDNFDQSNAVSMNAGKIRIDPHLDLLLIQSALYQLERILHNFPKRYILRRIH